MKRRTLIASSGLLLAGRAAFAQPARKLHRIGVLTSAAALDFSGPQPVAALAKALLRGLGELGYVYGQHYVTEARSAEGKLGGMAAAAAEMAGLGVDVIVAAGPTLKAAVARNQGRWRDRDGLEVGNRNTCGCAARPHRPSCLCEPPAHHRAGHTLPPACDVRPAAVSGPSTHRGVSP